MSLLFLVSDIPFNLSASPDAAKGQILLTFVFITGVLIVSLIVGMMMACGEGFRASCSRLWSALRSIGSNQEE